MTNLKRAHEQLFRRTADETYHSLDQLADHCRSVRAESIDHWERIEDVAVTANLTLGVRRNLRELQLSPQPDPKDIGRRPLTNTARIAIDQAMPDPKQPRKKFSDQALDHLSQSIRDQGQLSPIRVRWSEELAKWIIIAGERRWRACKRLGLATIECCFREDEVTRTQVLQQQLVENLLREDLGAIEEARAFAKLIELNG